MATFNPADYEHLLGKYYRRDGYEYKLMGVLYAEDDWYWVLARGGRFNKHTTLLSCVGTIEDFEFELVDKLPEADQGILPESEAAIKKFWTDLMATRLIFKIDECSEEAGNSKLNFKDEKD